MALFRHRSRSRLAILRLSVAVGRVLIVGEGGDSGQRIKVRLVAWAGVRAMERGEVLALDLELVNHAVPMLQASVKHCLEHATSIQRPAFNTCKQV